MRTERILVLALASVWVLACSSKSATDEDAPRGGAGAGGAASGGAAGRGGTGAAAGTGTGGSAAGKGGAGGSGGSGQGAACAEVERCCPRYTNEIDRQRCDGIVIIGDESSCSLFLTLTQEVCGNAGTGGGAGSGGSGGKAAGGAGGSGGGAAGGPPEVDCGSVVHEGNATVDSPAALGALAGVTEITGSLDFGGFTGTELTGLESLRCVGLGLAIYDTSLTSTKGLDSLLSVGDISIRQNAALQRVDGFAGLVRATMVGIVANPSVTEIAGFGGLTQAGVTLRDNPRLTRVSAFSALTFAPAGITMSGNTALTDFGGFVNLVEAQAFGITAHDALESLDGFAGLRRVGSVLRIENNESLSSVAGLASLESTAALAVEDNPMLPDCDIQALVDRVTIGSTPMISGNLADSCSM